MEPLTYRDAGVDIDAGDEPRQRMDVLGPTAAPTGPWPVLVFFYGGGWDSGSRDLYGWAAQALAAQGFVVALPDYRVVPQVVFPAFIEDAAVATAKAADVAAAYGGDPERRRFCSRSPGNREAVIRETALRRAVLTCLPDSC